jgi:DNA-binding NtrC family response regulator
MRSGAQPDLRQVRAQKRILSVGHNSALLRVRNNLMETGGYHVVTTKESGMLMELLAKQHFDALVLWSSIPAHIQENIAREAKAVKAKVPLIVICARGDEARFQRLADRIVLAEQGVSQPLLEAVLAVAGDPDG